MRNYVLKLAFEGTNYHGFQLQKNADTVQGRIEQALIPLFKKRCAVAGCSRTDAGVHAREFYCAFKAEKEYEPKKLKLSLCAALPRDITVYECFLAPEDFHPRFDALSKQYSYQIWNNPVRNPFLNNYSYHCRYNMDIPSMEKAAESFLGAHYFDAFCSAGSTVSSTLRTVTECRVAREGDLVKILISADGFLYNMVRIIAGTLLYVGSGRIAPEEINGIIEGRDRSRAGFTAPAKGLCLERVNYSQNFIKQEGL